MIVVVETKGQSARLVRAFPKLTEFNVSTDGGIRTVRVWWNDDYSGNEPAVTEAYFGLADNQFVMKTQDKLSFHELLERVVAHDCIK